MYKCKCEELQLLRLTKRYYFVNTPTAYYACVCPTSFHGHVQMNDRFGQLEVRLVLVECLPCWWALKHRSMVAVAVGFARQVETILLGKYSKSLQLMALVCVQQVSTTTSWWFRTAGFTANLTFRFLNTFRNSHAASAPIAAALGACTRNEENVRGHR